MQIDEKIIVMKKIQLLEFMECDEGYYRHELDNACYIISYLGSAYIRECDRKEIYEISICDVIDDEPAINCVQIGSKKTLDSAILCASQHFQKNK